MPHDSVPPHPSVPDPHMSPCSAHVLGMQLLQTLSVQISPSAHLPQFIGAPVQALVSVPQFLPCCLHSGGGGVGLQTLATQLSVAGHPLPQVIVPPQPLEIVPHSAPTASQVVGEQGEQVLAMASHIETVAASVAAELSAAPVGRLAAFARAGRLHASLTLPGGSVANLTRGASTAVESGAASVIEKPAGVVGDVARRFAVETRVRLGVADLAHRASSTIEHAAAIVGDRAAGHVLRRAAGRLATVLAPARTVADETAARSGVPYCAPRAAVRCSTVVAARSARARSLVALSVRPATGQCETCHSERPTQRSESSNDRSWCLSFHDCSPHRWFGDPLQIQAPGIHVAGVLPVSVHDDAKGSPTP